MDRNYPRDTPPLWLLVAVLVMVGLHAVVPLGTWLSRPWTRSGWVVIGLGVALSASSALRFRRAGTGVRPFTTATTLVAAGAFRWTRNPMYLGFVGITVGVAVLLGSYVVLPVPALLWWLLARRFVRAEEGFLRDRFSASYDAYCARVRRWL